LNLEVHLLNFDTTSTYLIYRSGKPMRPANGFAATAAPATAAALSPR
jgi:hypothetical protein